MSAIHGVAWGLVERDLDARTHQILRLAAREELKPHGLRLIANGNKTFRLVGKRRNGRRHRIMSGSFEACCKRASAILTPSDHNPAE